MMPAVHSANTVHSAKTRAAKAVSRQLPSPMRLTYARAVARLAVRSLHEELCLYPKPGLVSLVDTGSHDDMDAVTFMRSLFSLRHYFKKICLAGWDNAPFAQLKQLGIAAEAAMLKATRGINTHRGAIFSLGMLCATARRAQLMDDSLATHPGQALVTITGLPLQAAATLAASHNYQISIETGDDSCITGGPAAAAQALEQAIVAAGGRSRRLPVEVASHTHYMESAVAPFAEALRQTNFNTMSAPVLAGINATAVTDKAQAVDLLSRQLAEKVRWLACMDAAAEAGITYALELGPGNALTRMLQSRQPHINARSVADFRSLDGIRKWLDRAAED
jgi:hypothetical protein